MACRSFNSPIARTRFCVSARMIDPRRSPSLLSLSSGKYPRIGTLESSPFAREMLCNLRFWLMLPSRWSNDRSTGSWLPSLPISAAWPLSALRRYTFDITIPRECASDSDDRSWVRRSLMGFEFCEITGEGLVAVVLDASVWIQSAVGEILWEWCSSIAGIIFVCSENIVSNMQVWYLAAINFVINFDRQFGTLINSRVKSYERIITFSIISLSY